jgi:serine/threonine-protein kinase PpkA
MASVYLAVQESLDRHVALKLLKRFDEPTESERFLNEGKFIASLNHRNIITIHDLGLVGERHYISMEYLEGGTLQDRIQSMMSPGEALDLLVQVGECLDFAHRKGIVHRDIKPANILFHGDGTPILSDFGIAKQRATDSALTMDGMALGSPYYLSPEQAEGLPLDGRADLYALGVILFELLTGRRPYEGRSPVEVIMAHLTQPVPELPEPLSGYQDLLVRLMAKGRHQRFPTAGALVKHVRALRDATAAPLSRLPPAGKPDAPVFVVGRKGALGIAALGGVLIIATAAVIIDPDREEAQSAAAIAGSARSVGPVRTVTNSRSPQPDLPSVAVPAPAGGDPVLTPLSPGSPTVSALASSTDPVESIGSMATEEPMADFGPSAAPDSRAMELRRQQTIQGLLALAQTALEAYDLTKPAGRNAHHYYRQVLDLEAAHPQATQGIVAVADAYGDLVVRALDQFDYPKARRYLRRGLAVDPDNERLAALAPQTVATRDAPRRLVRKVKSTVKSWF